MIEIISKNWLEHFLDELKSSNKAYLISPFITNSTVDHLIENMNSADIKIITRFNLNDFRSKVSSLSALKKLVRRGIQIKGIKNLHSKVYVFENSVIIGSANFTSGGFFNNYEYGVKSFETSTIIHSSKYFFDLWNLSTKLLTIEEIEEWERLIKKMGPIAKSNELPDLGTKASLQGTSNKKIFIKFFGKGDNRVNLTYKTKIEIERTHCHWALTFSGKRGRPRKYNDGDIVYMARMLEGNDYGIFGKGIAIRHEDKRDKASPQDIEQVNWKVDWPIYIRVHQTEFIDGTMRDCPKMNNLIRILKFDSFENTQSRYLSGEENFNVKDSLRRQADIQLSEISAEWLENKFQEAMTNVGAVSEDFLKSLYSGSPEIHEILK